MAPPYVLLCLRLRRILGLFIDYKEFINDNHNLKFKLALISLKNKKLSENMVRSASVQFAIFKFMHIYLTLLLFVQIRFILLQNRQGKTRLSRWYVAYNDDERKKIEVETHRTIVGRDNKMTSFLEVSYPRGRQHVLTCDWCVVQEP